MANRVEVIKVPRDTAVPAADIPSAEWMSVKDQMGVVKGRVLDLGDFVDLTGTQDGTSGFEAALQHAVTTNMTTIYVRSGATVKLSGTPAIPDGMRNQIRIVGDGPIGARINMTTAGAALQMDPNGSPTQSTRRSYWRLENLYITGPGKDVSGSVGIHVNNALLGKMEHVVVTGFETGIHFDAYNLANGTATYYNTVIAPVVTACAVGMRFGPQANSNTVYGGRVGMNDLGVWIEATTNNVEFFGTDIEGNGSASTPAVVIDGYGNGLIRTRLENNSATYDVQFNRAGGSAAVAGAKNVVMPYLSNATIDARIKDDSPNKDNFVMIPGRMNLGNSSAVSDTAVIRATRTAAADGEPFLDLTDSYSSSGAPIGLRYRSRRAGTPFLAETSTDGTTWSPAFRFRHLEDGTVELTFGNVTGTVFNRMRWVNVAPEGNVTGRRGDLCINYNGGDNSTLYVKESGDGTTTGWRAI